MIFFILQVIYPFPVNWRVSWFLPPLIRKENTCKLHVNWFYTIFTNNLQELHSSSSVYPESASKKEVKYQCTDYQGIIHVIYSSHNLKAKEASQTPEVNSQCICLQCALKCWWRLSPDGVASTGIPGDVPPLSTHGRRSSFWTWNWCYDYVSYLVTSCDTWLVIYTGVSYHR